MPASLSESVIDLGVSAKGTAGSAILQFAAAKADKHEFDFLFETG